MALGVKLNAKFIGRQRNYQRRLKYRNVNKDTSKTMNADYETHAVVTCQIFFANIINLFNFFVTLFVNIKFSYILSHF